MEQWRDWIGRTSTTRALIDPVQCRKMQATLDCAPTLDVGDTLPPAWHWLFFHDSVLHSDIGADGHQRLGLALPDFTLPRRMWAGGSIEWRAPLIVGEAASRRTTVACIEPKDGRTGSLVFVTLEHEISQAGGLRILEHQQVVYRDAASGPWQQPIETQVPEGATTAHWPMDAVRLFRYSALTFNGHRIHYDADYARDVEGYPHVVIHGPLHATLLLDLASRDGRTVRHFEYRARNATFLPEGITAHCTVRDGAFADVWTTADSGYVAMEGTVTYRDGD